MSIDIPQNNDNRNYDYSNFKDSNRLEYSTVIDFIRPNSRVVDLGCGNGALLARLKNEKNIVESGIEISESGVEICQKRGLQVQLGRIDERLPFVDNAFDYAICNVTIQMVTYPEILLKEMKRVSKYQIISFPNFAFWKNRIELLISGRMPQKMLFGYSWYSTGHIHQLSISDFCQLVEDVKGLTVIERKYVQPNDPIRRTIALMFPNLFHSLPIFLLEKQ